MLEHPVIFKTPSHDAYFMQGFLLPSRRRVGGSWNRSFHPPLKEKRMIMATFQTNFWL